MDLPAFVKPDFYNITIISTFLSRIFIEIINSQTFLIDQLNFCTTILRKKFNQTKQVLPR